MLYEISDTLLDIKNDVLLIKNPLEIYWILNWSLHWIKALATLRHTPEVYHIIGTSYEIAIQ